MIVTSPMPTIAAVIVAKNEADILDECLISLDGLVDEVIVVDLESTDGTRSLAARHGATVLQHPTVQYADSVRAIGMAHARGDWILLLDPDERIGSDLARELRLLVNEDECDVIFLPYVNSIFGRELHAPGAIEFHHPRLFRRGRLEWPTTIHTNPDVRGLRCHVVSGSDSGTGSCIVMHVPWRTPHQVLEKFSRYVHDEAERRHAKGARFGVGRMLYRLSREFGGRYVVGRCYEDGLPGLFFSAMYAAYELGVQIELWQMEGSPARQDPWIRWSGRVVGEPLRWVLPLWMQRRRRAGVDGSQTRG